VKTALKSVIFYEVREKNKWAPFNGPRPTVYIGNVTYCNIYSLVVLHVRYVPMCILFTYSSSAVAYPRFHFEGMKLLFTRLRTCYPVHLRYNVMATLDALGYAADVYSLRVSSSFHRSCCGRRIERYLLTMSRAITVLCSMLSRRRIDNHRRV